MKMKILIFGSNGMLGNYILSYLNKKNMNVEGITRNDYDLSTLTEQSLEKLLVEKNINENFVLINSAGVIPQASKHHNLTEGDYYKINSIFPIILSKLANKYNCKMFHITTDCVFSGKKGNYIENDCHDASDTYGISKSLGEFCDCTIIRTSIIGEEIYNKRSLLEWVKSNANKEINGYCNHFWNGVTCLELSKIIYKIIAQKLYWTGVRHIFSPDILSKYDLVSIINEIYNLNIHVKKFNTDYIIDKTISTMYGINNLFFIKTLREQIIEMYNYNL